ncbi:MAG: IclR family transcriptional regulator C-terminal domain-containing protein [Betaproteobacteria bacterium]
MSPSPPLLPHEWIAGLEKGLSVIEAFDTEHPRMTATEVGRRCNMTRTAARRYLKTLTHLGYMSSDGKLYWLMPRTLRLGHAFIESTRLPKLVQPHLQRITQGTEEIAYLGVLDGGEAIFLARSGSPRHTAGGYWPGTRVPAQVTAVGMAILASWSEATLDSWLDGRQLPAFTSHTLTTTEQLRAVLKQFREQGWALSEQQLELNYRGVAVPLLDRNNTVHGAISVTMPINREETDHALERVLPVMLEVARSLRSLL